MVATERIIHKDRELEHDAQLFVDWSLQHGLVRFGDFETAIHRQHPEAPRSPVVFNIREAQGKLGGLRMVRRAFASEATRLRRRENVPFEAVAGIPTAMTVYMGGIAEELNVGHVGLPAKEKTVGVGERIAGAADNEGKIVLPMDDVFSTGDSKIPLIEALRDAGMTVTDLLVFLDRSDGEGEQIMAEHGVKLHAIITMDQLLVEAQKRGKIRHDERMRIRAQHNELKQFIRRVRQAA